MKVEDKIYVWFDPEGDFLEVTLDASKEGTWNRRQIEELP